MKRYLSITAVFLFAATTFAQRPLSSDEKWAAVPNGYNLQLTVHIKRADIPSLSAANFERISSLISSHKPRREGKKLLKSLQAARKAINPASLLTDRTITTNGVSEIDRGMAQLTADEKNLMDEVKVTPWSDGRDFVARMLNDTTGTGDGWDFLYTVGRMAEDARVLLPNLKVQPMSLLTDDEARTVDDYYNELMWRASGPSPDNYGRSLVSAADDWKRIENKFKNILTGNDADTSVVYQLSADKMMRLITLVGFNNYSDERVNDLKDFLPVGAELQLRFYVNPEGKALVKMVLNGKDARQFGMPRGSSPYNDLPRFLNYVNKRIKGNELHRDMLLMGNGRVMEPNGMVVWEPVIENGQLKCIAGTHPLEDGSDYGRFFLSLSMNSLEADKPSVQTRVNHPDYLSLSLDGGEENAEITGMAHTGFFRFSFKKEGKVYFVIAPDSGGVVKIDTARNIILGYTPVNGRTGKNNFNSCFGFQLMNVPDEFGEKDGKVWVAYIVSDRDEVLIKAANSFVDDDGVEHNFMQEIPHWEFYDTRMRNVDEWQRRMCRPMFVKTLREGDKAAKLQQLLSMSILPRQISDKNGRYPSFADGKKVNVKSLGKFGNKPLYMRVFGDFPIYGDRVIWDYQWTTNDLRTAFVQSLIYKAQETGNTDPKMQQIFNQAKSEKLDNISW